MKTSITFLKSNGTKAEAIALISETDTDYIHVDIMDGEFVQRTFLPITEVRELLTNSKKNLDIHLMVKHPQEYIEALSDLNVKYITIHVEIEDDIKELIKLIHSYGIGAGLAINPKTDINSLNPYLDNVEYVLIMGVTPGEGGQPLIPETIDRISYLRKIREDYNYHYKIALDGGVNGETRKLMDGLDIIVCGSYVCMSDNYQEKIDTLR